MCIFLLSFLFSFLLLLSAYNQEIEDSFKIYHKFLIPSRDMCVHFKKVTKHISLSFEITFSILPLWNDEIFYKMKNEVSQLKCCPFSIPWLPDLLIIKCISLPLQIGIALYLLYMQVKFAFLSGIAITILLIPGTRWLVYRVEHAAKLIDNLMLYVCLNTKCTYDRDSYMF